MSNTGQAELRGVVRARSVVPPGIDVAELRIRPQQLLPLGGGAVEALTGQEAGERVRHVRAEEVDRRRVAHSARRQVLARNGVVVVARRQSVTAAGDLGGFGHELAGQLPCKRPQFTVEVNGKVLMSL